MGATVEAKNPDGQFMEGVITKLTDASVYTVGKHSLFFLSEVMHRRGRFYHIAEPKQVFNYIYVYLSSSFR